MEEIAEFLTIDPSHLEVGDWLGGGSQYSAVFKGVWHHDNEAIEVAIKKIQLWKYSDKESTIVISEIKTMQALKFENICRMYGACEVNSFQGRQVWIVMEYADGGDLHNFMKSYGGSLPQDLQRSFLVQASKAVHVLHNRPSPILHRDIKSLNFLVQKKTNKLLLTDFGLSKPRALTHPDTFTVGSLRWVAPEIVLHKKKKYWTEKSDIFSLGMVFYEILTRELPYSEVEDNNLNVLLDKVKDGVLPKLPNDCPKGLAALIKKCWSFKPENRLNINDVLIQWDTIFDEGSALSLSAGSRSRKSTRNKSTPSQATISYSPGSSPPVPVIAIPVGSFTDLSCMPSDSPRPPQSSSDSPRGSGPTLNPRSSHRHNRTPSTGSPRDTLEQTLGENEDTSADKVAANIKLDMPTNNTAVPGDRMRSNSDPETNPTPPTTKKSILSVAATMGRINKFFGSKKDKRRSTDFNKDSTAGLTDSVAVDSTAARLHPQRSLPIIQQFPPKAEEKVTEPVSGDRHNRAPKKAASEWQDFKKNFNSG